MMLLIRTFLVIFALHTLATQAELSTIERIKKHQEWLRQRGLLKPQTSRKISVLDDRWKIKEPTKPLWQKVNNNNKADDPRKNDVFPENETTTASAIKLSSTSINTSELPIIPTETTSTTYPVTKRTPTTTTTQKTTEQPTTTTSLITTTTIESTASSTPNIPAAQPTTTQITTTTTIFEETPTTTSTTTTTTTPRPKPKPKPYPRWGTWSNWSACSRTCGGGVMWQQRKCISKRQATGKRYISNDCMGIYRRYHLCNEQACPSAVNDDFRQQQCSAFDDVDFQGRKYVWEPYIKDDAECELNCKPLGMKYFATLNNTVIDGTACFRPAEYYRSNYRGRAICVGGICKVGEIRMLLDMNSRSGSKYFSNYVERNFNVIKMA